MLLAIDVGNTNSKFAMFDGDKLVIALSSQEGGNRPAKFESAEGSKVVVVTFQRCTAARKASASNFGIR